MKEGRPTKYTQELANKIFELIATTQKSMATICNEVGIPYGTHLEWVRSNEEYSRLYARAKEDQADLLAEQILEISDDKTGDIIDGEFGKQGNQAAIQRSRLQVDSRKWIASKLKPKKYGDKLDIDHKSNGEAIQSTILVADQRTNENISELLKKFDNENNEGI